MLVVPAMSSLTTFFRNPFPVNTAKARIAITDDLTEVGLIAQTLFAEKLDSYRRENDPNPQERLAKHLAKLVEDQPFGKATAITLAFTSAVVGSATEARAGQMVQYIAGQVAPLGARDENNAQLLAAIGAGGRLLQQDIRAIQSEIRAGTRELQTALRNELGALDRRPTRHQVHINMGEVVAPFVAVAVVMVTITVATVVAEAIATVVVIVVLVGAAAAVLR